MKVEKGALEISTAIDEELMRSTPLLEKRIPSLWSFANIATLIGLLGTIYGLIRAFSALAAVSPDQKAAFLARGISEAMNNTAVGLGIAIICMIGHLILSGRSKRMISDLDVSAISFENFLLLQNKMKDK
jgi:biopolymer transport protein ExbB/TolQ